VDHNGVLQDDDSDPTDADAAEDDSRSVPTSSTTADWRLPPEVVRSKAGHSGCPAPE
jgi:hypothetical protein